MQLEEITSSPKDPNVFFTFKGQSLGFNIIDFWKWNQSDLIENRNRGILAEFLVRQALNIDSPIRLEWDAYDLKTSDGIKIEIKSAAYIQAWEQEKYSKISFDIKPTKTLLANNNYSIESTRKADVYIFCLLHHKDQTTIDPMNLDQWTFYIIKRSILDKEFPTQKSISLTTIESIYHEKCEYKQLKERFENLINTEP